MEYIIYKGRWRCIVVYIIKLCSSSSCCCCKDVMCNIYGGGGGTDPPRISRVQNHRLYQKHHTSHKVERTIYKYIELPQYLTYFSRLFDELCRHNFEILGIIPLLFVDGVVVFPFCTEVGAWQP